MDPRPPAAAGQGRRLIAGRSRAGVRIGNTGRVFDSTSDNGCSVNYPRGPEEPACGAAELRRIDLAAEAGVDLKVVHRLCTGDYLGIKLATLVRVAFALGCAPAELLPVTGSPRDLT